MFAPAPDGAQLEDAMSAAAVERLPERGLGLALDILEQVARSDGGLSAAEIARHVRAARATVYRVVNALARDGYLMRPDDVSGFVLGPRALDLADAMDESRLRALPRPLAENA
ncbi:hypothetical protein GCM10009532_01150 [Microbacterium aurantiacum]